jgi:hypothetical protein
MNWDVRQAAPATLNFWVDFTQTGPNPVMTAILIRHFFAFGFEPAPKMLRSELETRQHCNFSLIQQAETAAAEGIHKF